VIEVFLNVYIGFPLIKSTTVMKLFSLLGLYGNVLLCWLACLGNCCTCNNPQSSVDVVPDDDVVVDDVFDYGNCEVQNKPPIDKVKKVRDGGGGANQNGLKEPKKDKINQLESSKNEAIEKVLEKVSSGNLDPNTSEQHENDPEFIPFSSNVSPFGNNTEKQSYNTYNTSPSLHKYTKSYDISAPREEQKIDNIIKKFAIDIKSAIANFRFDIAQEESENFVNYLNSNKIDENRIKKISEKFGIECNSNKIDAELASKLYQFEEEKIFWNEIKDENVPMGLVIDLSDFYYENRGSLLTEFFGDKECIEVEPGSHFMLTLAEYKLEKVREDNFVMKDNFTFTIRDFFYNGLFCVINYDNISITKDKTLEEKIMDNLSKYYKDNMILVILYKTILDYKVSLDFVKTTPMFERFGGRVLFHCEKHNDWQTEGKKIDVVLDLKRELTNHMFEMMSEMKDFKFGTSYCI